MTEVASKAGSYKSDVPVIAENHLKLARDFVRGLGEKAGFGSDIKSYARQDERGFVSAALVTGPWGSGKTSLLSAFKHVLSDETAISLLQHGSGTTKTSTSAFVFEFEAWRFEGERNIIIPLLTQIVKGSLGWIHGFESTVKDVSSTQLSDLGKKFLVASSKLAARLADGAWAAFTNPAGILVADAVGEEKSNGTKSGGKSKPRPFEKFVEEMISPEKNGQMLGPSEWSVLRKEFGDYCSALAEERAKSIATDAGERKIKLHAGFPQIVVVIDDLDRCSFTQIRAIFEALKFLFNLDGVLVLAAFDERQVVEALAEPYRDGKLSKSEDVMAFGRAKSYLEKFFQYSIDVETVRPLDDAYFDALIEEARIDLEKAKVLEDGKKKEAFGKFKALYDLSRPNPRTAKMLLRWLVFDLSRSDWDSKRFGLRAADVVIEVNFPDLWALMLSGTSLKSRGSMYSLIIEYLSPNPEPLAPNPEPLDPSAPELLKTLKSVVGTKSLEVLPFEFVGLGYLKTWIEQAVAQHLVRELRLVLKCCTSAREPL